MSTKQPVDVSSYVVYKSESGGSYHTRPTCAAKSDVPAGFDKGHSVLEKVEMYRVGEIEASDENMCSHCAKKIRRELGLESDSNE